MGSIPLPILITVVAGLLLMSGPARSTETSGAADLDLEPALNGAVSASGLFPTLAMEKEFAAYLGWVKKQGLSPLTTFEPIIVGEDLATAQFPSQRMEDQFMA